MDALCSVFGSFILKGWEPGTFEALWAEPAFPWSIIRQTYTDPDRLELGLWVEGKLAALGICETNEQAVIVRVIEGSRDEACPLAGKRAFILTDAAVNYAQLRGRREVWLQPANRDLVNLYVKGCGFSPPDPSTGSPFYWKKVKP